MVDKNIVTQVFSLSKRVRKESKELDKLPGAALAAVLGGSVVIGVVGGGLFWIPAAMSGAMFGYRAVVKALEYPSHRKRQALTEINEARELLVVINGSLLEIDEKKQLNDAVLLLVGPKVRLPVEPAALEDKSGGRAT